MDETHLIIVDLDDINNGDVHFIRQLYGKNNNARIIGFMKQVQKDQHTIFKNAGCNMILPKSSLIKNIAPTIRRTMEQGTAVFENIFGLYRANEVPKSLPSASLALSRII